MAVPTGNQVLEVVSNILEAAELLSLPTHTWPLTKALVGEQRCSLKMKAVLHLRKTNNRYLIFRV